jgi:hypothetical protein
MGTWPWLVVGGFVFVVYSWATIILLLELDEIKKLLRGLNETARDTNNTTCRELKTISATLASIEQMIHRYMRRFEEPDEYQRRL